MRKIEINIVPLEEQRFETLGDYYEVADTLHFKITDTGNALHNKLILIHELIEQTLTEAKGISETDIMTHDLRFEELLKNREVEEDDEPGEHKDSPYRQEHIIAETVERLMLNHINKETFKQYTEKITKVFYGGKN
jgi:hypothetical protein